MSFLYKTNVWERVSGFSGTGTITLPNNPQIGGFQSFASAFSTGTWTVTYGIRDSVAGAWENGIGTYTYSSNTLARTTVIESSNSGSLVSFSGSNILDVTVEILSPILSSGGAPSAGLIPALNVSGVLDNSFINWAAPGAIGGTTPASGNFTGIAVLNTSGYAQIQFTGSGSTNPNKYLRVGSGFLQVMNSAYSAAILTLDDSGDLTVSGSVTGTTGVFSNAISVTGSPSSGIYTTTVNGVALAVGSPGTNGAVKIYNWAGYTTWIDMPTVSSSGLGSGGPGANAWIAYAQAAGQFFSDAVAGDIVYRNTSGALRFGNTASNSQVQITSTAVSFTTSAGVALGSFTSTGLNSATIGATTPADATFNNLTANTSVNFNGVSGAITVKTIAITDNSAKAASTAFVYNMLASPQVGIGSTAPNSGAFTSLSATSTVSGAGFTNLFAAPPAIGGTTPASIQATTIVATSTITPSTTSGIVGTTLADNANAGSVGEFVSSTVSSGSAVSLTTNTPANITSISLTAGDWDVWGSIATNPAGTTLVTLISGGVNTTSASLPAVTQGSFIRIQLASGDIPAGDSTCTTTGIARINISATTTVYLVCNAIFTTSTCGAYGGIYARRIR